MRELGYVRGHQRQFPAERPAGEQGVVGADRHAGLLQRGARLARSTQDVDAAARSEDPPLQQSRPLSERARVRA